MIFISFDLKDFNVADIRRIANRLLDSKVAEHLNDAQKTQLSAIVSPTLSAINDEATIKHLFDDLIANFSVFNDKGVEFSFHKDEKAGKLYFSDKAGYEEARALDYAAHHPKTDHHH